MNILIISSYFGPETSVGVLRVNSFARHWANMGHSIHVVTMPYSGELPDGLQGSAAIKVSQVAPYFIRGGQSGGVQGYSKGASGVNKWIMRFQYWLKRKFLSNYLDPRLLWWPRAAEKGRLLHQETPFDVVYSTVPSYTAHSAAASFKSHNKDVFWVADYRDLWSGNPIFPGCGPVRAFERTHEKYILRNADIICSINAPLLSELSALHGPRNYLEVPNGFEDAEVAIFKNVPRIPLDAKVNIVYAGSILPGLQDPSPIFEAIKVLSDEKFISEGDIKVSFYGDYSVLDNFPLAFDSSVAPFIERCGKVPRKDILAIQKSADFLLFLGSQPVASGVGSTQGVVSGKIFEYLISGTEILAVGVTETMLVSGMLRDAGVGAHYGRDIEKIKSRLIGALGGEVAKVSPDMNYLDQFKRSSQARHLIEHVQAAMNV